MVINMQAREQEIISMLGITAAEWCSMCAKKPELATLLPETIKRHLDENIQAMGCDKKDWVRACKKAPQLLELNKKTLEQHRDENSKVLGIPPEQWWSLCNQEPALVVTNQVTLAKSLYANAQALKVSKDDWLAACLRRPALLVYKPETLTQKVQAFIEYVKEPKKLIQAHKKLPESAKVMLAHAPGRVLAEKDVIAAFMDHPLAFLFSAEKSAYAFTHLSVAMKDNRVTNEESAIFAHLDVSPEKFMLHDLYACLLRHQKKPVSLYHLASASVNEMREKFKTLPGINTATTQTMIDTYPCPLNRALKKRVKGR